ncbi:Alpha/Beta hydrolase protein [Cytidiella melzeri]|nr:Alpha/Beta hydrolase protein [Cytidiella melzeri]
MSAPMPYRLIHVGGLPVNVFSTVDLSVITAKVAVLFFLHGRGGYAEALQPMVESILNHVKAKGKQESELVIVTFDQRNHGHRIADIKSLGAWTEGNMNHAVDMYAMFVGTSKDVSFLIDFLPTHLFPSGEAQVDQWLVGGISLGGHATWWSLRHEPRLSMGIPIIGCPNYTHLIKARAEASGVAFVPPTVPHAFIEYLQATDAAAVPYTSPDPSLNPFVGKKILVLSGKDDLLVPWASSDEVVRDLNVGEEGVKKVVVYPGVGHECTKDMVSELAEFVWEYALKS